MATICKVCGHEKHCSGNVDHAYHKNASQYRPSAIIHCRTRHCENPLCSCVSLVSTNKEFADYMLQTVKMYGQVTIQPHQFSLISAKSKPETVVKKLTEVTGLHHHYIPRGGGLVVVFK